MFRASAVRGFRALVKREGSVACVEEFASCTDLPRQPPTNGVPIAVSHSCLNYKDGLVVCGRAGVTKGWPIVPGINLVGTTLADCVVRGVALPAGAKVVAVNDYLGQHVDGGYSERAQVPGDWLVRLLPGLGAFEAMAIGTAGFTAMQCVLHLERYGELKPGSRVLVTGAAGGVGSLAVAILAQLGHEVVASSGRCATQKAYLERLGAAEVIERLEAPPKPLQRPAYDAVIDTVGGASLASALTLVRPRGAIAACGNAAGVDLSTTVFPLILRGVRLFGVDSVGSPVDERLEVWRRLATDLPRDLLASTVTTIGLEDVPASAEAILRGEIRGRVVVDLSA